jgi:hypothetical protein
MTYIIDTKRFDISNDCPLRQELLWEVRDTCFIYTSALKGHCHTEKLRFEIYKIGTPSDVYLRDKKVTS